jgi:thiamine biosynthesis lipoprotein
MRRTATLMGTTVAIEVVDRSAVSADAISHAIDRAFDWMHEVEARCSRFDPDSELRRLARGAGTATVVSPILFEAVQFALAVAEQTGGAFDPAVGDVMTARGFNRHYRTGETIAPAAHDISQATYQDIEIDAARRTITLKRPVALDLGAVAKGLAVDVAARELAPLEHFAIDAGGDLFLSGRNGRDEPWTVGIRHPRLEGQLIEKLAVSDLAVCTSGDYERIDHASGEHHLMDPHARTSARRVASVTVVAANAMLADALSTATFVLGPEEGLQFLQHQRVEGLIVTPSLARFETPAFRQHLASREPSHAGR